MAEAKNPLKEYSSYISLGISIVAFATVYGEMRGTVNNHEKEIASIKADVRTLERNAANDKASSSQELATINAKLDILLGDRALDEQERRRRLK